MRRKLLFVLAIMILICFLSPIYAQAIPGDADGNEILDIEDARTIAKFVAGQIADIPNPVDADVNQDGKIDLEDAFIIAKRLTGQTRIVVVAPLNGSPDAIRLGSIVRIEVFEKFFPFNITGGTVRIQSAGTGYDSGDQPLTFERNGRSLYYHWNTAGLVAATDYAINVSLNNASGLPIMTAKSSGVTNTKSPQADPVVPLTNRIFEPPFLAASVDAFCPAPGIPLEFRRVVPHDSSHYPYLGPLGRGWVHNYDISLEEYTDGRIAFHGPEGFNRFFQSNDNGTYISSPGDYSVLVRNPDGTFQLKEMNGFVYRFRSDLRLDYEQDLNGNRITAIYNGSNQLVQIRHSSGKSFSLTYNTGGRISGLTDHAGRVTTYEYDSRNLMLTMVNDPAGNVTEFTYNPGLFLKVGLVPVGPVYVPLLDFRLQSIIYPDGTRVQYDYDEQARLVRQTGAWGANPVTYSYDADGTTHVTDALGASSTVKVNDRGQPIVLIAPDGAQTSNQYDTSTNLAQVTDPLSHVTHFSYDGAGNVTQVINPLSQTVLFGYDSRFSKPSSITNPLGKTTSFAYDAKGNMITTIYPDSTLENYAYDSLGNLISVQDAAGKTTGYTYNAQGQMTTLQNALGNGMQFSYNQAGDLQNLTDAKGHTVSNTRDTLGRLTRRTYPDGSHEDYEYDGAGKVTAFTNRRGERISFSYDVTGRLEWKTYPSGKKIHFLYDAAGYLASVEQISGTMTTLDTAYERDALHRITKTKVPGRIYPESYDVSYAYDAAGRRTFMSYPDGYILNYAYDSANRLTRISDAGNSTIVAYEYDTAGRRTKKTLGNGTYTTYQYDDLDRLTLLVNNSPTGAVQSRFAYTYNAAGMRTSMTTLEGLNSYTYDNTYQLTKVVYPDSRSVNYALDQVGNRTSITDNGATTNYSTNQLDQYTQTGTETFSYDTNGNLTTRTLSSATTTYGYDEDDRFVSVDRNGVHIDYRYDYQGRLVAKKISGQETHYIWDGINLIAEEDSTGTVTKRYVLGASTDELIVVTGNGINNWVQQDGLGNAVGVTDTGGVIVGTGSYDVYGNPRSGSLRGFTGMRWDEDAGLYYVRTRWYDVKLGRFIHTDPMTLFRMGNSYNYVMNDPTNLRDPLGLDPIINNLGDTFGRLPQVILWWLQYASDSQQLKQGKTPWFYFNWENQDIEIRYVTPEKFQWLQNEREGMLKYGRNAADYTWWENNDGKTQEHYGYYPRYGDTIIYPQPQIGKSGWVYFDWLHGYVYAGGMCPTFVQGGQLREEIMNDVKNFLISKINIPWSSSLLRSDIPIYGIASGKDFSRYRVQYGEGSNPSTWFLIKESAKPQDKAPDFKDISWMQGDLDLRGNLATWNTGLKNWSHLPWHAHEDPTDLNGLYTLRLTVFGKDGEKAEDKIQVEVGRAIAQCLPGIAISPDKKVVMRFPEQAITHPFRVYTILPLRDMGEETPALSKGLELIGEVYRVRDPGDRFIKDVSLEFNPGTQDFGNRKPEHIGIGRYDAVKKDWVMLSTTYNRKSFLFSAVLTELPSPKAIYALMYNAESNLSSPAQPPPGPPAPFKPVRPGVLVDNTFESDLGTFKQRDRIVGAMLSRDNKATPDGSYCLKFTNENHGGNFSSTLIDQPFDIAEYGTMTFDYRIGMGVKVDFFLKVDGRWYNLRFTGDAVDYRNKDVNMANLGAIQGVLPDDKWHTANVDLRYLLRQQTGHTRVDEIIMANWSVGGYMKLEFGNNPRGATYYMDNFKLTGPGKVDATPPVLIVDDFNTTKSKNLLGGAFGTYANPGTRYVDSSLVDVQPSSGKSTAHSTNANRALLFSFNTTEPNSYGGYFTSIANTDLSHYAALSFKLRCDGIIPNVAVGIRNKQGIEGKTVIKPYASKPDADGWQLVRIPLSGFRGLTDLSSPDVLFFSVANKDDSGKGSLQIDDLRFEQEPYSRIADFESPFSWTLLGGDYSIKQNGAAAISTAPMKDIMTESNTVNTVLRISYGGTIGQDYGVNGGFSYAIWRAGLNSIDARQFSHLVMRIHGERGGETPNIYLSDSVRRYPLRPKEMPPITREWQSFRLPLGHYRQHGIDLSHLDALEFVFEWAEQSGTIYVDDMRFE
jgi:RHS repeat-associated protein